MGVWRQCLRQPEGVDLPPRAANEGLHERTGAPTRCGQRGRATQSPQIEDRARVEHMFAVVKRLWGFTNVRYQGPWARTPTAASWRWGWRTCTCARSFGRIASPRGRKTAPEGATAAPSGGNVSLTILMPWSKKRYRGSA